MDFQDIPPKWLSLAQIVASNKGDVKLWDKLVDLTEHLPTKDDRYPVEVSQGSPPVMKSLLFTVYENLLVNFPLCEQYWCNYASWKFKLGDEAHHVAQIYSNALSYMPKSLIIWRNYLKFTIETQRSHCRIMDVLEDARIAVGHHFYAHVIYDIYLDFLKKSGHNKEYHLLLRRIIEIPMYHYCKYFLEFTRLLEEADIVTIKYFVTAEDLYSSFKLTWGDLLKPADGKISKMKELKSKLKKMFTDALITTQYHTFRLWSYERELKKPYYDPGSQLTRQELNTWNSYLNYLEINTLKDSFRNGNSGTAKMNRALLETAYERCLIRTADYSFFWLKYSNLKLNMNMEDQAKQVLIKGIYLINDDEFKLRLRLVDLEILSGEISEAKDLTLEAYEQQPDNLALTLKILQIEHLIDRDSVVDLIEAKLLEVEGGEFERQFDYLFREVLGYGSVSLTKIEALLKRYQDKKKDSYHYQKALKEFYRCYKLTEDH
ncbi:hypothetical protein FOA43_001882 [Brettanomyces nanus]|uniref:Pre-mRNA-processing factor 39 n=1 Tax=Eeniella nana TaxID=13502 RepID=A0A875RYF0_EENNA|nr:uncharacterized protein FOA43_001882 [Brettanomyces nanus]QPG74551.1 hypothetical protein FOA43_001882 [Brettanomyces nanus]